VVGENLKCIAFIVLVASARLRDAGLADIAHERIAVGDPADISVDEVRVRGADLNAIGRRALSAAQRLLLGSVSTRVAGGA
jgi:nucleotide-binding universal stress UspA family protein